MLTTFKINLKISIFFFYLVEIALWLADQPSATNISSFINQDD
jgi:hypothetical protein